MTIEVGDKVRCIKQSDEITVHKIPFFGTVGEIYTVSSRSTSEHLKLEEDRYRNSLKINRFEKVTEMQKIANHPIGPVYHDHVHVGCQKVTRDELETLLKMMDDAPKGVFPKSNTYDIEVGPYIKELRDRPEIHNYFLQLRSTGDYKYQGFYLGSLNDSKPNWEIINDNCIQVLKLKDN